MEDRLIIRDNLVGQGFNGLTALSQFARWYNSGGNQQIQEYKDLAGSYIEAAKKPGKLRASRAGVKNKGAPRLTRQMPSLRRYGRRTRRFVRKRAVSRKFRAARTKKFIRRTRSYGTRFSRSVRAFRSANGQMREKAWKFGKAGFPRAALMKHVTITDLPADKFTWGSDDYGSFLKIAYNNTYRCRLPVVNLNGLYDPIDTTNDGVIGYHHLTSNAQPWWRDEFATLYQKYKVHKVKVTVIVTRNARPTDTQCAQLMVFFDQFTDTERASQFTVRSFQNEAQIRDWNLIRTPMKSSKYVKCSFTYSPAAVDKVDRRVYNQDDDYGAAPNANPVKMTTCMPQILLYNSNNNGLTDSSLQDENLKVRIIITQFTRWNELPRNIRQDS